jgi:hypothetical protein
MMTLQTVQLPREVSDQQRLEGLRAQRSALTDQLESQTIRRDYLNQQLAHASGQTAASIHAQIDAVDASVKATTDALARVDEAVNTAVTNGLPASYSSATSALDRRLDQFERMAVKVGTVGSVGIVAIIVLLIQSFRRRRPARALAGEDTARMEQLQRAVDVIAVEVERISESQRFMAKNSARDERIGGGSS